MEVGHVWGAGGQGELGWGGKEYWLQLYTDEIDSKSKYANETQRLFVGYDRRQDLKLFLYLAVRILHHICTILEDYKTTFGG